MKQILDFLSRLKDNNNRDWFHSHKAEYELAREQFTTIVQSVIDGMVEFEPHMAQQSAKSCIFRINRDVRFSADKSPYKINFGASFNPEGKKSTKAGYYLQIQPGESFWGGGIYMPMSDTIKDIRQEIDYNFDKLSHIVEDKNFKKWYPTIYDKDKLSRPPKGYDANNPAVEYLKLKHFIYTYEFDEGQFPSQQALVKNCVAAFKALKPFNDFLNQSFEK